MSALVNGISLGSIALTRHLSLGDSFDIPIKYFPKVDLPTCIRVTVADDEICQPVPVESAEDVMRVLGCGDISVRGLTIEAGLLKGTIINRSNGVHHAPAYVKINGLVSRVVNLELPQLLDDGGSASRFAVALKASDMLVSGLSIELYLLGLEYPLAAISFSRDDPASTATHFTEVNEKIRQLQRNMALQFDIMQANIDRQVKILQERVDAFIEYTSSSILDNLADHSRNQASALFKEAMERIKLASSHEATTYEFSTSLKSEQVAIDSPIFIFGWYDLESSADGPFRWMGPAGLIRIPRRSWMLDHVEIAVLQVYGSHEPFLEASLDGETLIPSVERDELNFLVKLSVPAGRSLCGDSLYIESLTTGSPAMDHGSSDDRILSIAVAGITFYYTECNQEVPE